MCTKLLPEISGERPGFLVQKQNIASRWGLWLLHRADFQYTNRTWYLVGFMVPPQGKIT